MDIYNFHFNSGDIYLLSVAGTLIYFFIKIQFNRRDKKNESFNKAADSFLDTFNKVLADINELHSLGNKDFFIDNQTVINTLNSTFHVQKNAVMVFRRHIGIFNRFCFDRACKKYCEYTCEKEIDNPVERFHKYISMNVNEEDDARLMAISDIKNIIKYVKHRY